MGKKIQIKIQEEKTKAGSPALLSSFSGSGDPVLYCSSCVRRSPQPSSPHGESERLAEGWRVVCVGTEGRKEAGGGKEGAGQQAPPSPDSANHQSRCWWRFRLRTERTSAVNLSASSIGSKLRSAVSLGSLNQDLMGIALSGWLR